MVQPGIRVDAGLHDALPVYKPGFVERCYTFGRSFL